MLQCAEPQDFVIATGLQHSVRDFVERAGRLLNLSIEWTGSGLDEQGVDARSGKVVVRVDPRYFRPAEVDTLLGDAAKARTVLGWQPQISFDELVDEMVAGDVELARRDALMKQKGFRVSNYRE